MVPRTGFEPVISGLKGRRARPLHQRGGNTISSIAKRPPPAANISAGFSDETFWPPWASNLC